MKVLAGDIGGTKTLLHIADVQGSRCAVLHEQTYSSQAYGDFDSVLTDFFAHAPPAARGGLTRACFGVAGPVSGPEHGHRHAKITQLPWRMDSLALQSAHRLEQVRLINDFHAVAAGIDALGPDDLAPLNAVPAHARAPRLVVGAGTGLGVAQLMWADGRYRIFPSEGGHIHFAPTDAVQMELLKYLQRLYGRVSCERVVSGPGLVDMFRFLVSENGEAVASAADLADHPDPAAAIAARAEAGDPLARRAIQLFISIYGAIAGDLALVSLAYGGIYLAGGIAPKLLRAFSLDDFMAAYREKGRMSGLVNDMPVSVILNARVGLLGATLLAADLNEVH